MFIQFTDKNENKLILILSFEIIALGEKFSFAKKLE